MKDRSKAITADVEKATKASDNFIPDLSANKKLLEKIEISAKEL